MVRRLAALLLFFMAPMLAFADLLPSTFTILPSAESDALGGIHAARTQDFSTLFSNPAGFASVPSELSLSEVTLDLNGPVFSILSLVLQGTTDPATLLTQPSFTSLITNLYTGANMVGPVSFGYVGNGIGFGLFNDSQALIQSEGPTTLGISVEERILLTGGYAVRIPLPGIGAVLDGGMTLKGIIAGDVSFSQSLLALSSLTSILDPSTLLTQPFSITSAIGFDAGLRFAIFNNILAFGLTGTNLYTPAVTTTYSSLQSFINGDSPTGTAATSTAPLNLSFGVEFSPPLGIFGRYINALSLYVDYRNIIDFLMYPATAENIILKFSAGLEAKFLKILSIRAGFARGLPSVGLGLDLTVLKLNAAVFGNELSTEPGLKPVYNVILGLEFRY